MADSDVPTDEPPENDEPENDELELDSETLADLDSDDDEVRGGIMSNRVEGC